MSTKSQPWPKNAEDARIEAIATIERVMDTIADSGTRGMTLQEKFQLDLTITRDLRYVSNVLRDAKDGIYSGK